MTYFVPGTQEKDPSKVIMSLQQAHEKTATNTADIATNTANIATNTTNIATNTTNIATNTTDISNLQSPNYGLANSGGKLGVSLSSVTNTLSGNVALNNTANYFNGPSCAQGTTGTWLAVGQVNVSDASAATFLVKLWDGTTVIASTGVNVAAGLATNIAISGIITSPAGNIRISVRDSTTAAGLINFNASGNSKDSMLTVVRIA